MKYRRILAAFATLIVMTSVCSCGKDKKTTSEVTDSQTSTSDSAGSGESSDKSGSEKETAEKTTDKDGKKVTTAAKDSKGKETTTTKAGDKKDATTTTAKNGGGSSSGGNSSGGGSDNNTGGGNSNGGGSSSGGGNSSGGNGGEEVKEYTAEITLGSSPKVTGSNVTVEGSKVIVTAEGDYLFTGSVSEGQIVVRTGTAATEDKVTIVLNGVDISNSSAPAIFIEEAKRCTIKSKEGTVNYVSSGVAKKDIHETGAIFSNDTIKFKGNGELNVTATASHGINSDDDIVFESGTYNIDSRKSGIIANTDVTIDDGNINVTAGTNGIKSQGTMNINGGHTVIRGGNGNKEEKNSVYAAGVFNYKSGYLYAAGTLVSVPKYADHPFIVVDLGETVSGGSSVEMVLDGTQVVSMEPHIDFRCLMMLSSDIHEGSNFYTVINGNDSDEFNVSAGQNLFKLK